MGCLKLIIKPFDKGWNFIKHAFINMERLKPIIKPFDSEWNYIHHIIIKLISFWSWKCDNMSRYKFTSFRLWVNWICDTTLSIFCQWISELCIQRHKNHSKSSSDVGRFSQNLRTYKKIDTMNLTVNQEDTLNDILS